MKAGVDEFAGLVPDRRHHLGMAVPHVVHTNAAGEIDQFAAVHIDHDRPVCLLDKRGGGVKGSLGYMLVAFFEQCIVFAWHSGSSLIE